MHPISDKELDKLFQQRFGDFEVEPSNDVWGKISNKMDNKKSGRRSFSPFWMAAASVIVVISAGLWFTRPLEIVKLQGNSEMAEEKVESLVPPTISEPTAEPVQEEPILAELNPGLTEFSPEKSVTNDFKLIAEVPQALPEVKPAAEQPQIVIASNPVKKPIAAQQKQAVKVPARYSGDQSQLDVTQPDMIAKVDVQEEQIIEEERVNTGSKKIRSIGSLVNFVIAQVDKRDDKLIEFKDGVEGSEVSGINLGLVKIKSRK
ncbi:hypothetical protein SAMN05421813_10238 [Daejeonella rubra]|uniref:Uncharacterized protein n=1 Tax=Daejeonella rubra TaxID=990371 RepID=A0A1G9MN41_9SPHI|nr:hypothetical protein [Daejeonella rubra]SDL75441.1 hypothetical protein SAMN05421813_10238 [Daejeonella rubra]